MRTDANERTVDMQFDARQDAYESLQQTLVCYDAYINMPRWLTSLVLGVQSAALGDNRPESSCMVNSACLSPHALMVLGNGGRLAA